MEKTRKMNWTKEEEYTLIDAIQAAGDLIRGTGQSAEINKKKKALWNGMMSKVNSIHGNSRDIKDIKKKWNNLKVTAKARVDNTRREVRRTGGGPNAAGEVEDEDALILAADKELSTSATERVSQMLEGTPAFSGISGSVDLFQGPLMSPSAHTSAADLHLNESSSMVPVPEELEAVDSSRPAYTGAVTIGRSRKRKRTTENLAPILSACDLLPLQHEVLCKQLDVFSAQLDLIEEQREYYRLKKQILLEKQ